MINWKNVPAKWSAWSWKRKSRETDDGGTTAAGATHLELAHDSLSRLLHDDQVPGPVRDGLSAEYQSIHAMLDKIENGEIHVSVIGRVSVGKSSLLNALLGSQVFSTSPLHGETVQVSREIWQSFDAGGVLLLDTPGLDEVDGQQREQLAYEAANQSDIVLFVVDSDLTGSELQALRILHQSHRVILLLLNKADRYSDGERAQLLESLRRHGSGLVLPENVLACSAAPAEQTVVRIDADGREQRETRIPAADVSVVVERLWQIVESEGQSLAALNASLFASRISDQVSTRIMQTRRSIAEKVIRYYCIAKGVSVALNPVPVADLAAAAALDSALVYHLSRVYDLPMSRRESGRLVAAIFAQLAALMGAVWTVHLASSLLKIGSAGLSTLITASGQGAIAYYSTYVVGQITERYLQQGKSWGDGGPKQVAREILAGMNRSSIIETAREDILGRLKSTMADDSTTTGSR